MNVGATKEGTIAPIFQERLLQMGLWLKYHGEAIYGTKPWKYQNDTLSEVWYTCKKSSVYAIMLQWPERNILALGSASALFTNMNVTLTLLGWDNLEEIKWTLNENNVIIILPERSKISVNWAWVLKIKA